MHTYGNAKNTPVENNKTIQANDAGIILVMGLHLPIFLLFCSLKYFIQESC